jgi:hypothetical protein
MKSAKILITCTVIATIISNVVYFVSARTIPFKASAAANATLSAQNSKTVEAGSTWVVNTTTRLRRLSVGKGATIVAPEGYDVTLSVNGIGKTIKEGTYSGNIVLSITKQNVVKYSSDLTHYFKQALYVDSSGVAADKSVLAEIIGGSVSNTSANNLHIISEEEKFNGIYVSGGVYNINGAKIRLTGNGGNDFAGYGAGIMSTGAKTKLIVNNTNIQTHGAIRPAIVAGDGSNLIVKNTNVDVKNGILPSGYKPNAKPGYMKSVPWMLGLSGNCRATNAIGNNTTATYINSSLSSEGWGVLSVDDCRNTKLTAINSGIANTGNSGYGAYATGSAVDSFYGCKFKVADYGLIITNGSGVFGSSTPTKLGILNSNLNLGLTSRELKSLQKKQTTVKSGRFGVMWHGNGSVDIGDGTVFETGETTFLVKSAAANINVDGSKGAHIQSRTGVILQLMDNDDPGTVQGNDGVMYTTGVYHEPNGAAELDKNHDTLTATKDTDTVANFSNMSLKGNFYNSTRGGMGKDMMGKMVNLDKNLSLKFDNAKISGVISSSTAKHKKDTITSADYKQLGEVTNKVNSAVNNGVIVSLTNGSNWTVAGDSYLTSLTIDDNSKITAPGGYKVTMKVNGIEKNIRTGTYKGNIKLAITPIRH